MSCDNLHGVEAYYHKTPEQMKFTPLTEAEEQELFKRYAAGKDSKDVALRADAQAAKAEVIERHLLFVAVEALKVSNGRYPSDEAISAANEAVLKLFDKFKPTFGVRFSSYIKLFIKGAVCSLWKSRCVVKVPSNKNYKEESISTDEKKMAQVGLVVPHEYLAKQNKKDRDRELFSAMNKLTPRERLVVQRHYVDGVNFAAIGRSCKPPMSRENIRKTHNQAVEKLRLILKNKEIFSA